MSQPFPMLVIVVVALLVIAAAYQAYVAGQRRRAELAALSARLWWRFTPASETGNPKFAPFGAFTKGHLPCALNTLRGAIEVNGQRWPVQAGDFRYITTTTTSGQHQTMRRTTHPHHFSYVIIETPHHGAPELVIRREGLFDRFAGFMGFDDTDFESAEFSEKFFVASSDKRFAYAVLDPRMMEFLLAHEPPTIEFRRGLCCLLRGETRWTAEEFAATFAWMREFFAHWPREIPSILDS